MKLSDLYANSFVNWLTGGNLVSRDRLSALGIKPVYNKILTQKSMIKVWIIRGIPVHFEDHLTDMVRRDLFREFPTVRATIQYINSPTDPQIGREIFKRQLARAEDLYNRYKEFYDNLSDGEQITGKSIMLPNGGKFSIRTRDVKRAKDRYDSFTYVYKTKAEGGEFFRTRIFVQAYCEDTRILAQYTKRMNELLNANDIFYTEVRGKLGKYLKNFGPATYENEETKYFTHNLMSNENLATLMPNYTSGLVGGQGALMGLDWISKFPFYLDFLNSTQAQILMFIGLSGWGKTFAAQMAIVSLVGLGLHANICDLKGGEWTKLEYFFPVLRVDLDGPRARFVNTMRLDDLNLDKEDAIYMYQLAVDATVNLLKLMVNVDPIVDGVNADDVDRILKTAVKKMYDTLHGFEETNPKTYWTTKDMKYSDIIEVLEELLHSKSISEKLASLAKTLIYRLSVFFKGSGEEAELFRNEITLSEVLNHRVVVYSLNKNSNPTMSLIDDIKVFMISHLNRKKHYIRKKQKLHTVDVYEELQRTGDDVTAERGRPGASSHLLKHISSTVTGSRSDNVMVMLLLNSVSAFKQPEFAPIRSNVTTVVAGKLQDGDIEILEQDFNCRRIGPHLRRINSGSAKYKNVFAVKAETGFDMITTMYKVVVPEYVERELRQRDVVDTATGIAE